MARKLKIRYVIFVKRFISLSCKLRVTSPDKQASMHAPQFGAQSKQSGKQPFQGEMKASTLNLKIKTECHTLKSASGYVSKNGCEWDSNSCPHQPET